MTKNIDFTMDWKSFSIDLLNDLFMPLPFEERIKLLYRYFDQKDILVTTSCGTKSIFLLHLLHRIQPNQTIHFINTTYHFPETLTYKTAISQKFDLDIVDVHPKSNASRLTKTERMWEKDPDSCCAINKVKPLEPLKQQHKIWMSGLMSNQTAFRSNLKVFEMQDNIIKFHPNVDVTQEEFDAYMTIYDLPRHPLEAKGFGSVGCTHCTVKGKGREGRWKGQDKTECGLHPDYFKQKLAQIQNT